MIKIISVATTNTFPRQPIRNRFPPQLQRVTENFLVTMTPATVSSQNVFWCPGWVNLGTQVNVKIYPASTWVRKLVGKHVIYYTTIFPFRMKLIQRVLIVTKGI